MLTREQLDEENRKWENCLGNREEVDENSAVDVLYAWATGEITTRRCDDLLRKYCSFVVDFTPSELKTGRYEQTDITNVIVALYVPTGEYKWLIW